MALNKNDKINRVLGLYDKLMNGAVVYKSEEAKNYDVNERTIQRDIDDIRDYMEQVSMDTGIENFVVYDRLKKGYCIEQVQRLCLTNSEILAVCKILLDSRAFTKREMDLMLQKLIDCCVPKCNQRVVMNLIRNEQFHYVEPRHKTVFIDKLWKIGQAMHNHQYIEINYTRLKDKALVVRMVKPVAIMFSEYYFYLAAFIEDEVVRKDFEVLEDTFPTIYRIDRIKEFRVLEKIFHTPYASRFEAGEFRKRIQFMYGGKLQTVKFKYFGLDIDAVLDRLPTAQVLREEDGVFTIKAEVFGKGIDMWLRSQGDLIEICE